MFGLTIAVLISLLLISWIVTVAKSRSSSCRSRCLRQERPWDVIQVRDILTRDECGQIRELAETRLSASHVYTPKHEALQKSIRESRQCWLRPKDHPALMKLSRMASLMSGYDASHQEDIQIAKYDVGGFYKAHYDSCKADGPHSDASESCDRFLKRGGQRLSTLLVYLNEGMGGGETHFPIAGRTVVPKTGSGVHFVSSTRDGKVIPESLHGGQPVTSGEKWIATIWTRQNRFV